MTATDDEGVLDPWVKDFFEANPERNAVFDTLDPEILELARGDFSLPSDVEIASVDDAEVEGIPIRIYRHEEPPTADEARARRVRRAWASCSCSRSC